MIEVNLDIELQNLPRFDVDARMSERIKRRALLAMREQHALAERRWKGAAARFFAVAEAPFAAIVVSLYLAWLIQTLIFLA